MHLTYNSMVIWFFAILIQSLPTWWSTLSLVASPIIICVTPSNPKIMLPTSWGPCNYHKKYISAVRPKTSKKTNNFRKWTKYETCAILHRFHILYISCECNHMQIKHLFFKSFQIFSYQLITECIVKVHMDLSYDVTVNKWILEIITYLRLILQW